MATHERLIQAIMEDSAVYRLPQTEVVILPVSLLTQEDRSSQLAATFLFCRELNEVK